MDDFARADDDDADLYADDAGDADFADDADANLDYIDTDAGDDFDYIDTDAGDNFDYIDTGTGDPDDGWFLMCSFLQCSCVLWQKVTLITKRNPQPRFATLSRN